MPGLDLYIGLGHSKSQPFLGDFHCPVCGRHKSSQGWQRPAGKSHSKWSGGILSGLL